jgi:hypothetical protein
MNPQWFGAKSVYRTSLTGTSRVPDEETREAVDLLGPTPWVKSSPAGELSDRTTLLEERIVLLRANNAEEALQRAEAEASEYARVRAYNSCGQKLVTRVLDYIEVYEIGEQPGDRVEVFSRSFLIRKEVPDSSILAGLCPEDGVPTSLREFFEPNLLQTAQNRK